MNEKTKAAVGLAALAAWGGAAVAQDRPVTVLPGIVVTATDSERGIAEAPASISVVGGEGLRKRPMNDLADAVKDQVGIGLENVGQGRRGISIRGMSSEHTLMLVDGQRISSSASAIAHSEFELGWVPAEAIERVEVVRGPMSSLYGSDALGGVVNVITRSATDRWSGSAGAYAVINDHHLHGNQDKTSFYIGGPLAPGKLGLTAWGEYRHRDHLRDAGDRRLSALDRQRAITGHLGLSWTPDARQRVDLSVDAGSEDMAGVRAGTNGATYSSGADVRRRRYSLSHEGQWDWGSSRVRLYRSTLYREAWRSDGADATGPNRFVDTVFDTQASFAAGASHRLTIGGQARRETLEDPSVNLAGKKSQDHYALFAQDEIVLGEAWELVLGSRFDHHEDFGWEVSPRAYLMFYPAAGWTLKAGMGRGFKAPTLKQLSPEYESRAAMGGRGVVRGNPNLNPETNRSFELGAVYERNGWSAGATLFRNDVRNLIETVRQPTCYVPGRTCLEYENVARVRLQGLELTGSVEMSPQWRVSANYTYLDARDRADDVRLPDRSRHRANATLAWQPLERLSTRIQYEYIGAQYRSATLSERPGYSLWHWYVDYDLSRNLSMHVGIENLADKRLANDDAGVYGRADEGRRYYAGLRARF